MSNVTASSGFIHVISVRSVRTLPTAKAGTPNKSPGEWGPIAGAQALRQVMVRTIGYIMANATALHCGYQAPHERKSPGSGENRGLDLGHFCKATQGAGVGGPLVTPVIKSTGDGNHCSKDTCRYIAY